MVLDSFQQARYIIGFKAYRKQTLLEEIELMARIEPLNREDVPEMEQMFRVWDERMGYLPNALMTMVRKPAMVKTLAALSQAVHDDSSLPHGVRGLVGQMASLAHGCQYCTAHNAANNERYGIEAEKIEKMWEFESSDLFSAAEKAAIRYAMAAASVPNAVDDALFADLRKHFNDTEIVEIQGIVSYYGWWNRWNDSFATKLEQHPLDYANTHLDKSNWQLGKHG